MFVLDMDGVLCDFVQQACLYHGRSNPYKGGSHYKDRDMAKHWGIPNNVFQSVFHDYNFWRDMLPTPEFGIINNLAQALDTKVVVASHATLLTGAAYSGKVDWVGDRMPWVQDVIISRNSKHTMAKGNVLLDDDDKICSQWRANGGKAFLLPRVWNSFGHDIGDCHVENFLRILLEPEFA